MKVKALVFLILVFDAGLAVPLALGLPLLMVDVKTGKLWYNINENIDVYGSVLLGGGPVAGVNVALEVHDPVGTPVITRSLQTNSSGVYTVAFRLQQQAPAGGYNVYVSCSYSGETAFNSTSFQASALAVTVTTDKSIYNIGDNVTITGDAMLNNVKLPNVLIALEVQDPNATPIVVRVLETGSQGAYSLMYQAPSGSVLGTYRAYVSASHDGAVAAAETSFVLKRKTSSADINGDGKINILDVALVARAFGSRPGDPRWDLRCDLDGNNIINIIDITIVARQYKP